ncbi:hypothetical protein [Paenibacillus sp. F4]|uniref:hypothetical protein n=1 Tax=Paenibacillus sp. F4 TaxID=357385 RepID=UPI000C9FACB6|nr:hypothetical protein [Paenibacillus sp. F4]PNQ80982.1 hypothetical protein C1T21_11235 [Paenibacillus sp. F4]
MSGKNECLLWVEKALRGGVDLLIAVAVGFFGLYKTFKGKNPTAKANAYASPDSTPSLCHCPPQSHSFSERVWSMGRAKGLKYSKAPKLIYLKEQRI